tara:strand:+ start:79 stop:1830 length:1752 start_codon:yes stop_codon:yes gene_type:complete
MRQSELRKAFLSFFESKGHTVVLSSSLLPDDPSVLLTTAGMQQFKPYYTGEADPMTSPHPTLGGRPLGSKSTASIQKTFRTSDIEEVGDERHNTFFEMMGNFSFGGYFKEEAIAYAKEFLDSINVKIDYVTIFEGDDEVPRDEESVAIWGKLGFSEDQGNLKFENREENFWGPTGTEGPCGPTTEIYAGGIEIWNLVFNQYYHNVDKSLTPLQQSGIDTGMGLERLAMVVQGKENIFETDLFQPIYVKLPSQLSENIKRILVDHVRAIGFLISDGIRPANKDSGYILRRLIRRVVAHQYVARNEAPFTFPGLFEAFSGMYKEFYPNIEVDTINQIFKEEQKRFHASLEQGLRELDRMDSLDNSSAFMLFESFGIPYEIIKEVAGEKASSVTKEGFAKEFERHQEVSRSGQERKFGGHGLILDTGELKAANQEELELVTRLHTATHLLQAALRQVLGESVQQAGSDITAERTRFDFTFDRKLTDEEKDQVEKLVNESIQKDMNVGYEEFPYEEAIHTGALHFAKEKYPAKVKVYTVQDSSIGEVFSKELCGGPHVNKTSEVGQFKIIKEESVAAGVRRIRATIE